MRRVGLAYVAAALLLTACGGFQLSPVVPMRSTIVSSISVAYGTELGADKTRMLDRLRVPAEMQRVLAASLPGGPGPHVHAVITQFHSGRWGPTRMHVTVQLVDPAGQVLRQIEADSTAVMGSSRGDLIQRVAQDCVDQIAGQL